MSRKTFGREILHQRRLRRHRRLSEPVSSASRFSEFSALMRNEASGKGQTFFTHSVPPLLKTIYTSRRAESAGNL